MKMGTLKHCLQASDFITTSWKATGFPFDLVTPLLKLSPMEITKNKVKDHKLFHQDTI